MRAIVGSTWLHENILIGVGTLKGTSPCGFILASKSFTSHFTMYQIPCMFVRCTTHCIVPSYHLAAMRIFLSASEHSKVQFATSGSIVCKSKTPFIKDLFFSFITIQAKDCRYQDNVNMLNDSPNMMSFPAGISNANLCSAQHRATQSNDEDDNCDATPSCRNFWKPGKSSYLP